MAVGDADVIDEGGRRMVDADKVAIVRTAIPADRDVVDEADVVALLGEPGWFRLLVALLEGGEPRVSDLDAATALAKPGQSRLTAAVGAPDRVGPAALRMAHYSLIDAHVRMLRDLGRTRTQHRDAIRPETHCRWTGSVTPAARLVLADDLDADPDGLNAGLGLWCADPAAGLVIVDFGARKAHQALTQTPAPAGA